MQAALKPRAVSSENGDFGFRRKAQVRTYINQHNQYQQMKKELLQLALQQLLFIIIISLRAR